jgi:Uma2 family endonuclease
MRKNPRNLVYFPEQNRRDFLTTTLAHRQKETAAMRYSEVLAGYEPDISHIVTEDDEPVDNLFSEHQQRLLGDGIHDHWHSPDGLPFIAVSNVGLFYAVQSPPIVPDFMLSLGVEYPTKYWEKRHRTYFVWEFGKSPELAVEVVSNLVGNELDKKFDLYAQAGISYYIVYDPSEQYGPDTLRLFVREGTEYRRLEKPYFEMLQLGCTLWEGEYMGMYGTWLRWTHPDGSLIPTGAEATEAARELLSKARTEAKEARSETQEARSETQKAHTEAQKAHTEAQKARTEAQEAKLRAEKLAEKLRALGLNPEE